MEEKRKSKRTQLSSRLIIKRLDGEDKQELAIDILDVSKGGVGFVCKEPLMIGAVYESYMTIWTKEVIHAFLQIVRIDMKQEGFVYGASFVGMPEMDANRIEVYQTIHDNQ